MVVPRLKSDLEALLQMTSYVEPPEIPVRSSVRWATYVIGDGSGTGFGTCIWTHGQDFVRVEFGLWTEDVEREESSNFREACNLVIKVIRMVKAGQIKKGSEVFSFTNNEVMERTYTKGSSKNPKLHDLIVVLWKLQMEGMLIIHFIWISGTRMILQGTDAFSRGEVSTSEMSVDKFLESLPLNKTAFVLQGNLRSKV